MWGSHSAAKRPSAVKALQMKCGGRIRLRSTGWLAALSVDAESAVEAGAGLNASAPAWGVEGASSLPFRKAGSARSRLSRSSILPASTVAFFKPSVSTD